MKKTPNLLPCLFCEAIPNRHGPYHLKHPKNPKCNWSEMVLRESTWNARSNVSGKIDLKKTGFKTVGEGGDYPTLESAIEAGVNSFGILMPDDIEGESIDLVEILKK